MPETLRATLEEAYLLHQRPYRETSLLIDAFSREYGKIPLLAKGVKGGRGKFPGLLREFTPLLLSWTGKGELQVLTHAELQAPARPLQGTALFCGFYLNELLSRFLHRYDPHPEVFQCYRNTLAILADGVGIEAALRYFELTLLEHAGYGLALEQEAVRGEPIAPECYYRYLPERGAVLAQAGPGTVQGATLIGLRQRQLHGPLALQEAKRLMRQLIHYHLQGAPLKSRRIFAAATIRF